MSQNIYSNLPLPSTNTTNKTVAVFDSYYTAPLELDASTFDAIKGFFSSRNFGDVSAEAIAVLLIKQAKKDNLNPMSLLDTLKGLDSVDLSALVAEIMNYNRLKTSFLGYATKFTPHNEIVRNILS
jgi:hypothetical protein